MAYVVPTNRTTGDLITSAIWNQDVVANPIALSTALLIQEHQAGNYYSSQGMYAQATGAVSQDQLYATPFMVPSTGSYDRIGISSGSAVGNVRLGIYSDSAGLPGALVLDAGALAVTSGVITITISQSLTGPAKYWLACVFSAGPNVAKMSNVTLLHISPTSFAEIAGYQRAFTYGALPNPWGTPSATQLTIAPRVALRKA